MKKDRSSCPISFALDLIGDRWSLLIIRDSIVFGKRTYKQYLDSPEAISTNILANRLSALTESGLFEARVLESDTRVVEYRPTPICFELVHSLVALAKWGFKAGHKGVHDKKLKAMIKEFEDHPEKMINQLKNINP